MVACCGLLSLIFPQLFVWHFYCAVLRISTALCVHDDCVHTSQHLVPI
jgi:hypothetical protein